jgi:putative heme transporter
MTTSRATSRDADDDPPKKQRSKAWRIAQASVAVLIVGGIFFAVIPNIAEYGKVWDTIRTLGGFQAGMLFAATAVNLVTYWLQSMAAMPGLTFWMSAVQTQTTTTVANTLPGGGAIAVGLSYAMFKSWGYSEGDVARFTLITGIWNTYIKLGLPALTVGLLVLEGRTNRGIVTGAVVGAIALVVSVALLALILWKERLARTIGDGLGRAVSFVRGLFHKQPLKDWGKVAVNFRNDTIDLLRRRWIPLTITTVVSHVSLFLVLLACLRALGVSQSDVTWVEALSVFAFGRLVTALPITPGGLGVVELSYIGGLVWAGGDKTAVVAAVLLFRTLTYALQIPLGAITYPIWQRTKDRWHRTDRGSSSRARSKRTQSSRSGRSARTRRQPASVRGG